MNSCAEFMLYKLSFLSFYSKTKLILCKPEENVFQQEKNDADNTFELLNIAAFL